MPDGFKNSHFSWNELMTNDIEKAKTFYGALFTWTMADIPMEDGQYTMAQKGDERAAGLMAMPKGSEGMPPHWGAYVTVEDVDASAKKAKDLGATIIV
ncbi:MAG: VOC family protein, partial [Nitrospirae bacterium]|nr:VOC family protein [Candidatus Manganitrophaceae bacterium]